MDEVAATPKPIPIGVSYNGAVVAKPKFEISEPDFDLERRGRNPAAPTDFVAVSYSGG